MSRYRNSTLFLLAAVWGSTLVTIRVGLESIPLALFATLRYDATGFVLHVVSAGLGDSVSAVVRTVEPVVAPAPLPPAASVVGCLSSVDRIGSTPIDLVSASYCTASLRFPASVTSEPSRLSDTVESR